MRNRRRHLALGPLSAFGAILWVCAALAKAPAADPLAEAQALLDSGEWARAESLAAGVAAQTRDFLIAGRAETIEAQSLVDQGQMANAEPHARRALQFLTGASTPENLLVLDQARSTLAQVMTWAGKLDEALEFGQMVLARERSAQGVPKRNLLDAVGGVGATLVLKGRPEEAWPYVVECAQLAVANLPAGDQDRTYALNNVVITAIHLERLDEAQTWLTKLIEDCPRLGLDCDRGTPLHLMAAVTLRRGRLPDAERLFAEAADARLRQQNPDSPKLAESLNNLALLMNARGDAADAAPVLERVVKLFSRAYGSNSPIAVSARLNLVSSLTETRRFAEAQTLLDDVRSIVRDHPTVQPGLELEIGLRASRLDLAEGHTDLALRDARAAVAAKDASDPRRRAEALEAEADALRKSGRPKDAMVALRQALDIRAAIQPPTDYGLAPPHLLMAETMLDLGDNEGALTQVDKARTALPAWLEETGAAIDRGGLSPRIEGFRAEAAELELKARWGLRHRHPLAAAGLDAAFAAAQRHMFGGAGDDLAVAGAERLDASTTLARVAAAREAALQDLRRADRALAKSYAAGASAPDGDPALPTLRAAEARFLAADTELQRISPRYGRLRGGAASLATVQAALRPDEALVVVVSDSEAANVFVVTANTADWRRIGISFDDLCRRVSHLLAGLDAGAPEVCGRGGVSGSNAEAPGVRGLVSTGSGRPYPRSEAYSIWRDLFAPSAAQLRGKRRLILSTDGPLAMIPLGALVVRAPAGSDSDPDDQRRTAWLARTTAVSLLPEPKLLPLLRQETPRAVAGGFVGVGAPCRSACRAAAAPPAIAAFDETLDKLPPLPGASAELRALAATAAGPATLLLGPDATQARILGGALRDRDVVAFATHGVARDPFGASEPGLVLSLDPAAPDSPGLLTASAIARDLSIDASWVILSACDTAAPLGGGSADVYPGLARAFFAAGARSVLVAQGPVPDDVAARLTVPTLASRLTHAEALRQAEMALLTDRSHPAFADPRTWAMFSVIGSGD